MAEECWRLIKVLSAPPHEPEDVDEAAITLIEFACDSAVEARTLRRPSTGILAAARAAHRAGAGHECDEWRLQSGRCAVCDAQ